MMQLRQISSTTHQQFMESCGMEHFMQLELWGKVKQKSGWTYELLGVYEEDQLVASTLLLLRQVPLLGKIAYTPRGVILDYQNTTLLQEVTKLIADHCHRQKVIYWISDPDLPYRVVDCHGTLLQEMPQLVEDMVKAGFTHQGFNDSFEMMQPRFTFRLRLQEKSKQEIFQDYSKIVRTSMKNAVEYGIECKKTDNLDEFYELTKQTATRDHFMVRTRSYYDILFSTYHAQEMATCYVATYYPQKHLNYIRQKRNQLLEEKTKLAAKVAQNPKDTKSANRIEQLEIQLNKLTKSEMTTQEANQKYPNGVPLSAGITFNTAHRAWLVHGANATELREVFANYAIKQFEIEDDKDRGFEWVDFFGAIGHPTKDSEHFGIHDFKQRFSGDYWEFPGEFHYILRPVAYWVWTFGYPKFKQLIRKLRK